MVSYAFSIRLREFLINKHASTFVYNSWNQKSACLCRDSSFSVVSTLNLSFKFFFLVLNITENVLMFIFSVVGKQFYVYEKKLKFKDDWKDMFVVIRSFLNGFVFKVNGLIHCFKILQEFSEIFLKNNSTLNIKFNEIQHFVHWMLIETLQALVYIFSSISTIYNRSNKQRCCRRIYIYLNCKQILHILN